LLEREELLKLFKKEIAEKIDFIKFINEQLQPEDKIISSEFLSSLWEDIVKDPLDIDERDLLYTWITELVNENQ